MNPSLESKAASLTARASFFIGRRLSDYDEDDQIRMALGIATKEKTGALYDKPDPYHNMDKAVVLEGFRAFNDLHVSQKYPRLCCTAVRMVLQLQNTSGFSEKEANQVLNAVPQLLQLKEPSLRRLLYLLLQELGPISSSCTRKTELIWKPLMGGIASITATKDKDSSAANEVAHSIRVLSILLRNSPTDNVNSTMKKLDGTVKRILKSINSPATCISAVLGAATHLEPSFPSVVHGWRQAALCALYGSRCNMVHFHALFFLCHLDQSHHQTERRSEKEKLLLDKLKRKHHDQTCPLSWILLIRFATRQLLLEDAKEGQGFFLTACLTHPSELVVYEAAKALLCLFVDPPEVLVDRAMDAAQALALSTKPAVRQCGERLVQAGNKALLHARESTEGTFFF